MATVTLLNLAQSQLCSPLSSAATFSRTSTATMHLARPKSAKGRRRPSFSCSQSVEAWPCPVPPSPPAAAHEAVNSLRVLSTKPAFLASQVSPEEIPELLQQVPSRSSSSLNKYRVLPSIGWRGAVGAGAEQMEQLGASQGQEHTPGTKPLPGEPGPANVLSESVSHGESSHMQCPPEKPGGKMRPECPLMSALGLEELPQEESYLLLAVRSPSGQRFQHRFKPTDSLQTVLAMAEEKMAAGYKHCSLETMEVPRRSFSDLTRSLHECGILHKSVLCIRQKEQ
ncbi:UBX10 protein, partial [Galbula dea]|nr:UBX10 protein [Galbula dea]